MRKRCAEFIFNRILFSDFSKNLYGILICFTVPAEPEENVISNLLSALSSSRVKSRFDVEDEFDKRNLAAVQVVISELYFSSLRAVMEGLLGGPHLLR